MQSKLRYIATPAVSTASLRRKKEANYLDHARAARRWMPAMPNTSAPLNHCTSTHCKPLIPEHLDTVRQEFARQAAEHSLSKLLPQIIDAVVGHRIDEAADAFFNLRVSHSWIREEPSI